MTAADKDFYRSVRKDEYPDGVIVNAHAVEGILYPSFENKTFIQIIKGKPVEKTRPADTVPYKKDGVDVVDTGHGTSLFDRENVFGTVHWWSFRIPQGTSIPASLTVRFTGPNTRFKADHYQIEPAALVMTVEAYKGALDNLARNAVQKSYEASRGL